VILMTSISLADGLGQIFFLTWGVLLGYSIVLDKFDWRFLCKSILISAILAPIGCLIEDGIFVLLFVSFYMAELINQKKLKINFTRLDILLLLISIQVLLFTFSAYVSRIIIFHVEKVHRLASIAKYGDAFTMLEIAIAYSLGIILIGVVSMHKNNYRIVIERAHQLNIDSRLFLMLIVLFGSIETLLLISNFEGVTATIQMALLLTFMLMLGLMSWQMILIIKTYMQEQAMKNEKVQNEQLTEYLKSVEQQYLELRKFKHDYRNLVLGLNSKGSSQSSGESKKYLKELAKESMPETDLDDAKIVQVQYLDNEALRGLVVQKFFDARRHEVALKLEVSEHKFKLQQDLVLVVRIIGNLLDNAIDQAAKMPDHLVTVAFNHVDDTYEISIENMIDSSFNLDKIFEIGYSTKGSNRGLGLTNVKTLVAKHENLFLDIETPVEKVRMTLIIRGE